MQSTINKILSQKELDECLNIRMLVFVKGQNVPLEEEIDDKDADSDHYLIKVDNQPVGVTRVRFIDDYAKIERVAILEAYQNKGLGKQLMEFILADIKNNSVLHRARLSSQTQAIPFYERLGFHVCSEEYIDAGIPHKDMEYQFNA